MSSSQANREEGHGNDELAFRERALRYQDGELGPSELAELSDEIVHNPARRAAFIEMQFQSVMLYEQLRLEAYGGANAMVERAEETMTRAGRRRRGVIAAVILSALMLGVMLLLARPARRSPLVPAFPVTEFSDTGVSPAISVNALPAVEDPPLNAPRLTQVAGAELFGELLPQLHSSMKLEHKYVLYRGMLELGFPGGAMVVLEAPAIFRINTPEKVTLQIGRCSVHAPPGAEGFQVVTPQGNVTDLGTRFAVTVDLGGNSDLHVVEGAARIHPRDQPGAEATLFSGDARRAGSELELTPINFNAGAYRNRFPDRIISYDAERVGDGPEVRDLKSVTVQRGGAVCTYGVDELIEIDVVSLVAGPSVKSIAWEGDYPDDPTVALSGDVALNSGLINVGSRRDAPGDGDGKNGTSRRGLGIRFRRPVVNGPGPDVVLFEVQSEIHPPEGDHFWIGPLVLQSGLRSHHVTNFDITMTSGEAKPVVLFNLFTLEEPAQSLDAFRELARKRPRFFVPIQVPFHALAVGVDLSDLGYPPGAEVEGLFIEADASRRPLSEPSDAGKGLLDPVFIGGFPPLEPDVIFE